MLIFFYITIASDEDDYENDCVQVVPSLETKKTWIMDLLIACAQEKTTLRL